MLGSLPRGIAGPLLAAVSVVALFCGPTLLAPMGKGFALVFVAQLAAAIAVRLQLARALGVDARLAVLQPVGALFLVGVLLRAAISGTPLRREIRWRARRYSA